MSVKSEPDFKSHTGVDGKEKGTEEVPPMQRMLYICMEMMVFMERRLVKSERNNASTVVGIVDYEEFKLRPKHAQTVVQNVIKTFGASNYSGNERNAFEAWTNFKAQIESAVKSYPKLLELVKEEVIGDVVSKRNLASAFATAATASWLQELPEVTSLASDVLSEILTQLFGQLSSSLARLRKLRLNDVEEPVKQLGAYADLQASIARYGGERLDARTVEVMVLATAVDALPGSYSQVVTDLGRESRPTFELLFQRCEYHYVNVLKEKRDKSQEAPTEEIVATTHGLLKTNDEKKRTCAVCASGGRATEACWQTNSTAMEVFIQRKEKAVRASFEERKKRIEATEKGAAAVMTEQEVWNAEEHEEVLIACSAVTNVGVCTGESLQASSAEVSKGRYDSLRAGAFVLPEVYDGELEVTHGLYDRLCDLKLMSTNSEARYHILHTNNVTGVPEASRAVDIKEWLLQYDDRLTVSESDLSVYFIDVPNALVVQLHSFINAVECITSSEDWKTSLLTAFNAKWSRS
ncbi:hypothetical protein CYMTET_43737 [Cymbomonas tetramitiformis]|uniref:Uncharacterized protein n=1 Tax=Cymbomonas tetramitiformis TaxID=36881 RepID=A0AAE0C1M1_9CHLO|nr:hypothetical protein CYMTET_43737 [Cymbomonas tetramitiformis]